MNGALNGRVAIVTGAGQGVGQGIALALAAAGASVVVAARRAETGDLVVAEILGRDGVAMCVSTDVGVADDVKHAVDEAVRAFGGVDIVVHNAFAGAGGPYRLEDATPAQWAPQSRTAVWGSVHCMDAAYRHLRASGRGRFIMLSSNAGIEGSPNLPFYGAVKGAQRGLCKSLARDWGADGITVNCIAPMAGTPALTEAFHTNPSLRDRLASRSALGRLGDPERDIGGVAVFLASDAGGYVTGQTIMADGGSFTGL